MQTRYFLLKWICIVIACIWAIYLFIVQAFDPFNMSYRKLVRYSPWKEIIIPNRGNIYDSSGELLASSIKYYQIDVDRNKVKNYAKKRKEDPNKIFLRISQIISQNSTENQEKIFEKLTTKKSNTVQISNEIKETELIAMKSVLEKENLDVIIPSFSSIKRIYSKGRLAARLLGLVREIQDDSNVKNRSVYRMEGFCGLEASFDDYLRGEYGWREIVYDANKDYVYYPNLKEKKAHDGSSLILTIDSEIQQVLEDNLLEGVQKYNAQNAIGVIMNPKTGEIIAMSGVSRKDNSMAESMVRASANLPVIFMFEPGSTFKPVISLLALDKKLFKPTDMINCNRYTVGKRTIKDSHELGTISFEDVIVKSSNVGISKIAERIGSVDVYNRVVSMGFGHKTGANIFGENSGMLKKYSDWSGYTLHSISFGQEIAVNALQLTNAYATIANGGKVLRPYILKEVKDNNGTTIFKNETKVLRDISNPKNIELEKQFLKNVVARGTATSAKMNYIDVGGKTGTAEKKVAGIKGYGKYAYTSVFTGFFPVNDPQYVMTILYDEPDYAYHFGSMAAVPTFKQVAEQIVMLPNCKVIQNIRQEKREFVQMPDLMGKSSSEAKQILNKNKIQYQVIENDPTGIIINQFPKSNVSFDKKNYAIIVIDNKSNLKELKVNPSIMPNLIGLTLRKAIKITKALKLDLEISGTGVITTQSIKPGETIKFQQKCKVLAQ